MWQQTKVPVSPGYGSEDGPSAFPGQTVGPFPEGKGRPASYKSVALIT